MVNALQENDWPASDLIVANGILLSAYLIVLLSGIGMLCQNLIASGYSFLNIFFNKDIC